SNNKGRKRAWLPQVFQQTARRRLTAFQAVSPRQACEFSILVLTSAMDAVYGCCLTLFVPLELKLGVLCLIGLPTHVQFEFASCASGHAREYARIGWKREWNLR